MNRFVQQVIDLMGEWAEKHEARAKAPERAEWMKEALQLSAKKMIQRKELLSGIDWSRPELSESDMEPILQSLSINAHINRILAGSEEDSAAELAEFKRLYW